MRCSRLARRKCGRSRSPAYERHCAFARALSILHFPFRATAVCQNGAVKQMFNVNVCMLLFTLVLNLSAQVIGGALAYGCSRFGITEVCSCESGNALHR